MIKTSPKVEMRQNILDKLQQLTPNQIEAVSNFIDQLNQVDANDNPSNNLYAGIFNDMDKDLMNEIRLSFPHFPVNEL